MFLRDLIRDKRLITETTPPSLRRYGPLAPGEHPNEFKFKGEPSAAIVVPDLELFELARMFEILRDAKGDQGIRVFAKMEEAPEWFGVAYQFSDLVGGEKIL